MQRDESPRRTVKQGTAREDEFLAALLAGKGFGEACKAAGIGRSTGLRIRQKEAFQRRFRDARSELLERTITGLHAAAGDCVRTLHAIANDGTAKGSDRVLAARHAIDLLLRGVEQLDFAERIAQLEKLNQTAERR
ncbi:MAG TPA: hypothetical protein VN736_06170 [Candidatus Limnocylindrales bacterium]|nr:hypothetical protein [Candidatus Limnocylindrales bacterium]